MEEEKVIDLNKPYRLGKITARHIKPMCQILKKVDLQRLIECFKNEEVQELIKEVSADEENKESLDVLAGGAVIAQLMPLILDLVGNCIDEVMALLSDISNLPVEVINGFGLDIFIEMIIDFVKKDEFKNFIEVVSRLTIKSRNM